MKKTWATFAILFGLGILGVTAWFIERRKQELSNATNALLQLRRELDDMATQLGVEVTKLSPDTAEILDAVLEAGYHPPPAPGSSAVEMTEWIRQAKFHTTRTGPGYDEKEVDDFLDGVSETFLGLREPPLTAEDVRNIQFSTTRLRPGYDEEDVDSFLDQVELALESWTTPAAPR